MDGYESHQSNFSNQNDGVAVYIRSDLKYTVKIPLFVDASCIIVKFPSDVTVIAVYRSPANENLDNFLESLNNVLTSQSTSDNIVLMGDLNINIITNSTSRPKPDD